VLTAISSSQIDLSWTDNSDNEDGFKIERKKEGFVDWDEIEIVANDVTTYNDTTGLDDGTTYYYRVRAYNTAGNSNYSNEANATTKLAAPSVLVAEAVSSSQIDLEWTDNSDNELGFKIERKEGVGGTWSQITIVGANTTTYQNTGLTTKTRYYYQVRAYNGAGNSNYSNEANDKTL